MSQEAKDNRIILNEDEARTKLLEGARASYEAVTTTFGPRGKNVLIEKPFGRPLLTRDGVTVARDVYFKDRAKNMGSQLLMEASEVTNRIAGDGTTGTVALAYHLLAGGIKAIAAGQHPMELKDMLLADSYVLLGELDKLTRPTKKSQLKEVATVSSGDPLLGQLIAEALEHVGADGGIITEKAPLNDVEREYVDGYYLQDGFMALQTGKKELIDPMVIVSIKRLTSAADANEVLTKTMQAQGITPEAVQQGNIPRILFMGNIEDAAYMFIVNLINRGVIDAIILKTPPMFGEMGKYLLEDIAIYAGCSPITESTSLSEFGLPFVGSVNKVVTSKTESTIFGDNTSEAVQTRIAEIKDQIKAEPSDAVNEKLKDRVAKLDGKIALFKIGAATDTAKEELEFRVEDSINATRAAYSHGVVPGGGITLLNLSNTKISDLYKTALRETFKQLLINADLEAEVKLSEALKAPTGHGFNLRKGGELVDMIAEGVLDPSLVVSEIIKNATRTVADALTVGVGIIFEDTEPK